MFYNYENYSDFFQSDFLFLYSKTLTILLFQFWCILANKKIIPIYKFLSIMEIGLKAL